MKDISKMTLMEIKEYVNGLSNEELDEFVTKVDLQDFDIDLDPMDLLTSSRLYDYVQYSHKGDATITFD